MLLNKMAYFLNVLAWQNSEDASKRPPRNTPEFKPLPGMEEKKKRNPEEQAMDIDDLKAFLSKPRM